MTEANALYGLIPGARPCAAASTNATNGIPAVEGGNGAPHALKGVGAEGAGVADGARLRTQNYYAPAARSPPGPPRPRAACRSARRGNCRPTGPGRGNRGRRFASPEVGSSGLPDTPLLGLELTLAATVLLGGLAPDEVVVQAVVGRVDDEDALINPIHIDMTHIGSSDDGAQIFIAQTALPLSGSVGYTVRVLPHHPLLASDTELGLVTFA